MPEGWVRVWGFKMLGFVEGVACYTVAAFSSYDAAVDFITAEAGSRELYLG